MKWRLIILMLLACINAQATLREWNNTAMEGYLSYTGSLIKEGQTFTVGNTGTNQSFILDSIAFYVHNAVNGNFTFEIFALSGGYPTGSALSSKTVTSLVVGYNYIDMPSKVLIASTSYAIVLTSSVLLNLDYNSAYTGGSYIYYDGSWSDRGIPNTDLLFEVYGRLTPTITTHPSSIERCTGASAPFSVVVDTDSPTYQWRKGGSDIGGATNSSYTINPVTTGSAGSYDCVVTESLLGTTDTSNAATLTVNTYISITSQPEDSTLCEGSDVTFSVTATGTLAAPNYYWYKDDVAIYEANSSTYSINNTTASDEAYYNALVIGRCGTVLSDYALLKVADMDYETLLTGLVSYWGFDGSGTYTTETDNTGYNNGTVSNVTRLGTSDYRSQYGHFDSNTDYITLTSADTRSTGTYSFWVYPTDRTDDRLIMGNDPYYSRIFLTITNGYLRVETNTNGQEFQFNSNAPPLNTWSHVALVRAGNNISYYLNGSFISTVNVSSANSVTIRQIGYNGRSFRGDIDEVSIYDRAITADEVSLIYHNGDGLVYSMLNICDYDYIAPPVVPGRKKILLASKLRNVLLASIERDFGTFASLVIPSSYGYDSTYTLACKQKFATPEDVANGDVVGTWLKTFTWMDNGTPSFNIATNWNSAFAIDHNTGVITVADYTKINGKIVQQDTVINLIINTEQNLMFENDTAQIWVKENAHCVFIDYSQGTNGSGTKSSPEKDIDDITITTGIGYFLKRGTTITNEGTTITNHLASAAHPTIFAAYGTGNKPKFNGGSYCFYLGDYSFDGYEVTGMYFYDLWIRNYTASAFYVLPPSDTIGIYNCDLYNNATSQANGANVITLNDLFPDYELSDSSKVYQYELINLDCDTLTTAWAFLKGCPHLIQNCSFKHKSSVANETHLVRISQGTGTTIKHCIFDSEAGYTIYPDNTCLQFRGDDGIIKDCRFTGNGTGIDIADPGGYNEVFPDNLTISNCFFKNQSVYGIYFRPSATSVYSSVNNIFQNNLFDGCATGIILRDTYNQIIRRNLFKNGTYGIYEYSSAENNPGLNIYYNVLYGFTFEINLSRSGTTANLYNNTVDGNITLTGTTSVTRNNFYHTTLTTNTSNNINIVDIVPTDYFIDYANHNYTLKSTATEAINGGYDVNLTPDIIGTTVPQGSATDVGAYEYIP